MPFDVCEKKTHMLQYIIWNIYLMQSHLLPISWSRDSAFSKIIYANKDFTIFNSGPLPKSTNVVQMNTDVIFAVSFSTQKYDHKPLNGCHRVISSLWSLKISFAWFCIRCHPTVCFVKMFIFFYKMCFVKFGQYQWQKPIFARMAKTAIFTNYYSHLTKTAQTCKHQIG